MQQEIRKGKRTGKKQKHRGLCSEYHYIFNENCEYKTIETKFDQKKKLLETNKKVMKWRWTKMKKGN